MGACVSPAVGKWEPYYRDVTEPQAFSDSPTYTLASEWVADCETVEDWGCGLGWMRHFIDAGRYVGVDGSASRFADVVTDLASRDSQPDGIVMRHVLEHNDDWRPILENALRSFRRRFALVVFTPFADTTHEIGRTDVPVISFAKNDLTSLFAGLDWTEQQISTDSQYGTETVFYISRDPDPGARPAAPCRVASPEHRPDDA